MFPQYVTHERRGKFQELLFLHFAKFTASHGKIIDIYTFQGEFVDGPVKPLNNLVLVPLHRVYREKKFSIRNLKP